METKSIALDQIESVSDASTFSYPVGTSALTDSIRRVGLLQPIAVLETGHLFRIIFGAKRVEAARELGWTDIPACTYTGMTAEELLIVRLHQDCCQRQYNAVEKARVLRAFQQEAKYTVEQMCEKIAARIDVPPTPEWVRKYLSLLEFDDGIMVELAGGRLNTAHAFMLIPFKPADRKFIFDRVIRNCQPSVSDCREILDNLIDMSVISDQSIASLLTTGGIADLLDANTLKPYDKCNRLRSELKTLRFPNLSKMESDFSRARADLAIGKDIRVRPPRFFEGHYLDVSFRARDVEELKKKLTSLDEARFVELFRIMRGES